jgi:2-methylisocitrate lyase-like PEP mutase family enzyme
LLVNVVGIPKLSTISTLAACGVKRISMAVFLYKATYNKTEMIAKEILNEQSLKPLFS